jgi:hypothetical protein
MPYQSAEKSASHVSTRFTNAIRDAVQVSVIELAFYWPDPANAIALPSRNNM